MKRLLFLWIMVLSLDYKAQTNLATPEGYAGQIDQVMRTQFQLPSILLTNSFKTTVTIYFQLDGNGKAILFRFDGVVNNIIKQELQRVLSKLTFSKVNPSQEVFLNIDLSTDLYRKWEKFRKQRSMKLQLPADSTLLVYTKADRSPDYYNKGEEGLVSYFQEELDYPQSAIEHSIQGTVLLEFIIEPNGFVSNIQVKQGISGGCTDEAVRLISETRWIPATIQQKYVRYKMTYPITFTLNNATRPGQAYGQ
jgi:TonB family protein